MKYSEFERTVKSMGLFINDREGELYVEDDSQFPVLTVSKLDEMVIDTEYPSFIELPYGKKDTLLILVVTLAKTPLAEREEEKRYWLQRIEPPILGEQDPRYLFYTRVGGYYDIGTTKSEWRNVIKTIFTESEIEDMDITGFEKVEVEE